MDDMPICACADFGHVHHHGCPVWHEITRLRAELAANKRVVDAARAVISNPAYQGICDEDVELEQAVAALAAKGE